MHLDAVRIGSAFLGRILTENKLGLKKIAYLESNVIEVKTLPKGYNIGYANTYKTKRETKIAVIPVGYMDGFGVVKANDTYRIFDCIRYIYHDIRAIISDMKVYVEINGRKFPVLGRVYSRYVASNRSNVPRHRQRNNKTLPVSMRIESKKELTR